MQMGQVNPLTRVNNRKYMSLDQLNSHIDALVRTTFIYEVFSDEKSETNDKGEEIFFGIYLWLYPSE